MVTRVAPRTAMQCWARWWWRQACQILFTLQFTNQRKPWIDSSYSVAAGKPHISQHGNWAEFLARGRNDVPIVSSIPLFVMAQFEHLTGIGFLQGSPLRLNENSPKAKTSP